MQTVRPTGDEAAADLRPSETAAAADVPAVAPPAAAVMQVDAASALRLGQASDSAVQTTALELRAGAPKLVPGEQLRATVSFYYCQTGAMNSANARGDGGGFCGIMRDGSIVYSGAAACDAIYLGQRFRIVGDPTGRVYKCADTGSAVHGVHRDIWFNVNDEGWVWQRSVGDVTTIEIMP